MLNSSKDVIEYLLNSGFDPNESDENGQTILMQAVLSGRPEIVQILVDRKVNLNVKNAQGNSAYKMAKNSSNPVIRTLLYLITHFSLIKKKKLITVIFRK